MNSYQVLLLLISIACCAARVLSATCTATPSATEGPYWVTGMAFRQNITEGKEGLPVILQLTIVDKTTCEIVPDATAEIWHCDAMGIYSHYEEASNNIQNPKTDDKTYLRGKQYTNSNGSATFHTIYPGWYVSRDTHIHMKIYNGDTEVLTSQLFFNDTLSDQIGTLSPYSSHNIERTKLSEDTIYSANDIMLKVTYIGSTLSDGLIAQGTVVVDFGNTATGSSKTDKSNGNTENANETSGTSELRSSLVWIALILINIIIVNM
jgi:protocatechuate 3,4-dioxygenase beta subunit